MDKEKLASRLRATFAAELEEQVRLMNADLLVLEREGGDAERLKSLFRSAHTLKGAARAAGLPLVESVCHALESLLAEARDRRSPLGADDLALLYESADAMAGVVPQVRAGRDLSGSPLAELNQRLSGRDRGSGRPPAVLSAPARAPSAPAPPSAAPGTSGPIRVDSARLDELAAAAGELLVAGSSVITRSRDLEALHDFALRWSAEWRRVGRELRLASERAGVGPAAAPILQSVDENLRKLVHDASHVSAGFAREAGALSQAVEELNRSVHGLRMRPFADACEPLPRTVRDLAAAAGKEVRLEVLGGAAEMDRAVVDGLREALLHLVRNAVDHGIEERAARVARGKPPSGSVTVRAALHGGRVVVTVSDDGAGLDAPAIRRRIEQRGLPAPADDGALGRALFSGGISTRAEASSVSGRGVGLDLVRAAVQRIRGSVVASWREGLGTTFTIECPPTLVSLRAVMVALGPNAFAVPAHHVERLLRVEPDRFRTVEGRTVLPDGDAPLLLVRLAGVLGLPSGETQPNGPASVVVLSDGSRRVGALVDELTGEQEVVLRPAGPGDATPARFVGGATLLGSGRAAAVLDVAAVLDAALEPGAPAAVLPAGAERPGAALEQRRILVVDDSITTRTLEQSVLEAAGYQVASAVDGADAWKLLQEQGCDLVVADIEMPRMDGFALCEAVRRSKRFKELPVVLVTALETPEHRARGLEVGADAYIGKSSFDQEALLGTIRQLLD